MSKLKPVVLVILDGWGHRDEREQNAIAQAHTPALERLMRDYPHGLINASELHVGLPEGQMGNSEVGHMNIGSGRVLMQDLPKIDAAIADNTLANNPKLADFVRILKNPPPLREGAGGGAAVATPLPNPPPQGGREYPVCHLMGLLSPGGVHSHQSHMAALANMLAREGIKVQVHAFLDGRDTPPMSALEYLSQFKKDTGYSIQDSENKNTSPESRILSPQSPIRIATISGRYYAMDRDKRWDRVGKAYDALVSAKGAQADTAEAAINNSYAANISDEFVLPTIIGNYPGMQDGDGLLMVNFRADRVREILTALVDPAFKEFPRERVVRFSATLGMAEYSSALAPLVPALFAPEPLTNILGEVVANAGMTQLRIAETEKYAHVTFFFNGGREKEFPGEERILVPSPNVATYDLKPEMSAPEVTDKLVAAIDSGKFDLIVVNYANTDMVGHTGNIEAAKKAVETVDGCVGRVVEATLAKGGALFITADHGNAEMMHDHDTGQAHTAHTLNLVPAIIIADKFKGKKIPIPEGKLGDVAPTVLQLLGLPQPKEMTGKSLLDDYA